jgi:uncharacterized membrane protein YhfC
MRLTLCTVAFGSVLISLPVLPQSLQFRGEFAPGLQEQQVFRFHPKDDNFAAALRADMKQGSATFSLRGPDGEDLGSETAGVFTANKVIRVRKAGTHTLQVTPRGAVGRWEVRITEPPDSRVISRQFFSGGSMILIALAGVGIWALVSGTPLRWFAAGAAIWAIGVSLKFAVHFPLRSWPPAVSGPHKTILELVVGSIYTGLMTGVFEIGITLGAVLLWRRLAAEPKRAVALGIGAGSFEALLLGVLALAYTIAALAGKPNNTFMQALGASGISTTLFWLVGPVERVITIACHIASRTLVLHAVAGRSWWGFWAGFALLSGVDTVAGFVHLSGFLQFRSVWWAELAILPFAIASLPLARWAVSHWPAEAGGSAVVESESAASAGKNA